MRLKHSCLGVLGFVGIVTAMTTVLPLDIASADPTTNTNAYWTQYGYDGGRSGFNLAEQTLGAGNVASLQQAWVAPVQLLNDVYATPIVTSAVYVSAGGSLEKLSLATGNVLWTASKANAVTPISANGVVVTGGVEGLSPATGTTIWHDSIGGADVAPSADGMTGFVATENNSLDAFDVTTGKTIWQTGHFRQGSPTVGGGMVFSTSGSGLAAIAEATGMQAWIQAKATAGTPVYADGTVYLAQTDLTAYQATTGKVLWTLPSGTTPAVANGVVYTIGTGHRLLALAANSGRLLWSSAIGTGLGGLLAVADGVVYVPGANHTLYAVDTTTGKVLWQDTLGGVVTSVVVSDGALYATASDNTLHAWRLP
jgi:outer membrane protein assembly factor BamB